MHRRRKPWPIAAILASRSARIWRRATRRSAAPCGRDGATDAEVNAAYATLNRRPRKRLGWECPQGGSSAHRRCACPENPPRKDIAGYVHVDSNAKEIKKDKLLPKPTYKQIREYIRKKYDMKVSTLNIITVKDELGLEKQFSWKKDGMAAKNRPQCPKDKQDAIIEAFKHFEMIS